MLNTEEIKRYARHIKLNNVGIEGQEKLKKAKVLVIGAGGLGCPVLQYLTAAGVGTIGIIDDDVVDESNLQRQILFSKEDVDSSKVKTAITKLSVQNPFVQFNAHVERLTAKNALSLFNSYDIIIDGTDNFPTRYLVNDACVITNKPLVFGSIYKFEGQISVFNYNNGPSYRCLYPEPPEEGSVPNCSDIGVIGVLPGVIGTRMASECIKLILEIGTPLSGKLEVIDVLGNRTMLLNVSRNQEEFKRSQLEKDYQIMCETPEEPEAITAKELEVRIQQNPNLTILDVREPFETQICLIKNSKCIPLNQIPNNLDTLEPNNEMVVVCHHGIRSTNAIEYLKKQGFNKLINLTGGIHSWALNVDADMATY